MKTSSLNYAELDRLFEMFIREKEFLENCRPRHIKFLRTCYKMFKRAGVTSLDKSGFIAFAEDLRRRNLSARTYSNYLKGWRVFLKWLYDNGHIEAVPKIPSPKLKKKVLRSLTVQEMGKIITAKPEERGQVRVRNIILTGLDSGCRIDEMLSLRREDIDFDNLLMKVTGKGDKERVVPFSIQLGKVLRNHLRTHEFEYVFATDKGTKLCQRNAWRDVKIFYEGIGVKPGGFHCCRRTFARHYLKNGGNLLYLQASLGHADIQTTKQYVEVETEDLQKAHAKTNILSRLKPESE